MTFCLGHTEVVKAGSLLTGGMAGGIAFVASWMKTSFKFAVKDSLTTSVSFTAFTAREKNSLKAGRQLAGCEQLSILQGRWPTATP